MTDVRLVCAVTGGTHGIGRHTAELLAAQGWAVAICSRHGDEAAAVAKEIADESGAPVIGTSVDVASAEDLARFAAVVAENLGPVSGVVANAAVLGPVGPLHTVDLSAWAATVAIDVVGVANTVAAFTPAMVARGAGSIVTLAGGGVGGPNVATRLSAYTTSKAAVAVLTETVATELEPFGVRLNAIAPGPVPTRFMDALVAAGPSVAGAQLFDQVEEQRRQPIALDRYDALLGFLLDPGSPFVTGRVLSARWESPDSLVADPPASGSSRYRLRRIDEDLYSEVVGGTRP